MVIYLLSVSKTRHQEGGGGATENKLPSTGQGIRGKKRGEGVIKVIIELGSRFPVKGPEGATCSH